ncbi:MAG: ABC transporter ATP-binding protein, partial [Eubacteriales bacterium]|nr:ABC transporter ATP-binding protein [Eubacteriales bacterium]
LYEPDEGKIYINGVDLRNIDYQSYLNLIAVVFQDYKTYAFSIRENVAINNAANQERLSVAYKASGLCTKIDRLANGDETILMRDYDENGIEVSGGETQKMAIARALYKNTPIVILDEPTAALDPVAEYTLFKDMQELQKDKLAIFITHRLTSTRFCDQIFVLACGGVHEQGTHKELIMKKGLYSEMYHKQAYYYRTQKTD